MTLLQLGAVCSRAYDAVNPRLLTAGPVENLLKQLIKIILALIISVVFITAVYILWGYYKINREFTNREHYIVQPQVDARSVSETGYVRQSKTVTCMKNRTKRLYFWVKIPATHKQYLCEWQQGFAGFTKDDAVTMIHQIELPDESTDHAGYLIGLQGKVKGKAASIQTLGVEDTKE